MRSASTKAERLDNLMRKLLRAMSSGDGDPLNDLPIAQLKVVRVLATGEKSAGDVGHELGLSPSALSQLVQRLACTGLIVKEEDSSDRRVKRLSLSKSGMQKVRERDKLRHAKATKLLQGLTDEEQDKLLELMEKLVTVKTPTNIQAAGDEAPL